MRTRKPTAPSHQHQGGVAAWRGHEFERLFGVFRVIRAAERHAAGVMSRLGLQLRGAHVDDWGERVEGLERLFQLRDRRRQTWKAVKRAFEKQWRLTPNAELHLVVGRPELAARLKKSRNRVKWAKVEVFPEWKTPEEHIRLNGPVRRALILACVVPRPTDSDLKWIWKELSFAWDNVRTPGEYRPITQVLAQLSDHESSPLRVSWAPTAPWLAARQHLERIPELAFSVVDGTLFFSTGGGFKGRMSCRSTDFRTLVQRLIRHRPKSVAEFEELL